MATNATAFDFSFDSLTGSPLPLAEFAGRPMIVVNTASKCGFTPQYAGLQALWRQRRGDGLVILGVPSNDFANQEPAGGAEIATFCEVNYGVEFPMTAKVHVRGAAAHPLFKWLGEQGGFLARPRWNFYKYLIGRDGLLKTWFSSVAAPGSNRFGGAVNQLFKPL